jgi:hypothetical protein
MRTTRRVESLLRSSVATVHRLGQLARQIAARSRELSIRLFRTRS